MNGASAALAKWLLALLVSALSLVAQADTVQDILVRIPPPLTTGRAIAMDWESESFVNRPRKDGSVDWRHILTTLSFRRDGERVDSRRTNTLLDKEGEKIPAFFSKSSFLLTNEMAVQGQYEHDSHFGLANVNPADLKKWASEDDGTGSFLSGLVSEEMFVPELLAKDPKLRPDMEDVNGSSCYVIECKTGEEDVVAWVCPEKGWNFLKYVVHKTGESGIIDWTLTVDNIDIEKVGEEFVPVGGSKKSASVFDDGRQSEIRTNVKATNIDFAPDFDAMGAFRLDIPDGAILNDAAGGLRYEVKGGKLFPYVDTSTVAALEQGVTAFLDNEESSTPTTNSAQPAVPAQSGQQATPLLMQRATFQWAAIVMIVVGAAAIILSVVHSRRKSSGTPT